MNNSEIIKKTIIDLLEKIGFESAVDLDISDKKNITVNIANTKIILFLIVSSIG